MATLNVQGGALAITDGTLSNSALSSNANISETKLQHRYNIPYYQTTATTVAAQTAPIYRAYRGGNILSVTVTPHTIPTSGTYTVDVQKAANGGSYATILTAVVTVNPSPSANNTDQPGPLATTTYSAGDKFRVVVAISSPANSAGVTVMLALSEDPQ